ncbi:hypothetical protein [Micromonospora haikouensis]|uniref:hypothetical protein n=1 Tax=Micromonospora haikouensis TaxID=686309 RepID=UPI003D8A543F
MLTGYVSPVSGSSMTSGFLRSRFATVSTAATGSPAASGQACGPAEPQRFRISRSALYAPSALASRVSWSWLRALPWPTHAFGLSTPSTTTARTRSGNMLA